jgi:hypothetical protein
MLCEIRVGAEFQWYLVADVGRAWQGCTNGDVEQSNSIHFDANKDKGRESILFDHIGGAMRAYRSCMRRHTNTLCNHILAVLYDGHQIWIRIKSVDDIAG